MLRPTIARLNLEPFTDRDFRFTTKGHTLYAIEVGTPASGEAVIQSLGSSKLGAIKIDSVSLLGSSAPIAFESQANGLHLHVPAQPPAKYAYCYKIALLQ